jgi:hypothetical protein
VSSPSTEVLRIAAQAARDAATSTRDVQLRGSRLMGPAGLLPAMRAAALRPCPPAQFASTGLSTTGSQLRPQSRRSGCCCPSGRDRRRCVHLRLSGCRLLADRWDLVALLDTRAHPTGNLSPAVTQPAADVNVGSSKRGSCRALLRPQAGQRLGRMILPAVVRVVSRSRSSRGHAAIVSTMSIQPTTA